jgi:hypothetical protein
MEFLTKLWMPIVLASVFCFVASALLWMVLPIHKGDYRSTGEKEDALLNALRGLSAGVYMLPWCQGKEAANSEKMKTGPWAMITVMDKCNMGRSLVLWFLYLLLVNVFVAYIAWHAHPRPGWEYLKVFQVVGATAFLSGMGVVCGSIWEGKPWSQSLKGLFDALIYALLTAGTFGWLWPKIESAAPSIPAIGG